MQHFASIHEGPGSIPNIERKQQEEQKKRKKYDGGEEEEKKLRNAVEW